MSDERNQGIKVTDRRMFTETGELREEFEDVAASSAEPEVAQPQEEAPAPEVAASKAEPPPPEEPAPTAPPSAPPPEAANLGASPTDASHGEVGEAPVGYTASARQPQFLDLVAMLAVVRLVPTRQSGKATGVVLMGFLGGLTVSAPLVGLAVDQFDSYRPGWIALGVLALVGAAVVRSPRDRSRRPVQQR